MYFETLQSISLNGKIDTPNDDRVGSSAQRAWVVDGATDLGEPGLLGSQGGAAWLSTAASLGFSTVTGADVNATCHAMFDFVADRFEAERQRPVVAAWELPKAAFAVVQLVQDQLEAAWAADCPVLLAHQDGVDWATAAPNTSVEVADAAALGIGTSGAPVLEGAVLEDRRQQRMRPNHTALSPDADASARITQIKKRLVRPGDEVLVMSDGFSALVSDYAAYDAAGLMAALRVKGLAQLAEEIREIETADAACTRFPRFKTSDDATAIWLRVRD
ncbi:hypothetical protein GFB49_10670 [Epibacterium sp. SM1979]|uniref:Protein phosphatase 2C n=1 Tax=Tritonibacter litoralis TaxID=2662264 RepID=A0A843YGH5_9RHOB|nr:hypothetical protein [Tritonibacter litoralis]MQQ08918.1 hypothetical protein [Tritonibacter litoralis]